MYNAFPFICEAWPDLVLLCDLKKVKTPIEESYTKYNTSLWVFFMFFKLYKMVPNREKHLIHIDRFWNSKVSGKSDSALMQLAFFTKKSWLSKYKEFFLWFITLCIEVPNSHNIWNSSTYFPTWYEIFYLN